MRVKYLVIALIFIASGASAQVVGLYNAELSDRTVINDPAKAMQQSEDKWLAFVMPVLAETVSPCCWKGKWPGMGEVGCSLKATHQSYGTRSDSPETERVIVFTSVKDGMVDSMRVVGEQCPVDANGSEVTWIGTVEDIAGLN